MKAVVFDFDGTLTDESQNVWKLLWERCGDVDGNARKELYKRHRINKEITRREWFDLTAEEFKKQGLSAKDVYEISKNIKLINGAEEVLKGLTAQGYDLYIVSGCLKESIRLVLGSLTSYFTDIEANMCLFDHDGKIKGFVPTKYDYEGKAEYIEGLKGFGYNPENIVYIGNSDNDEWVKGTGCKTICINPANADIYNSSKWDRVFLNVTDLRQIFIRVDYPAKQANAEMER